MIDGFRKLRDLLDPRERRNALLLLALIVVRGFVEAAGVASIIPFMAVLSNPQLIFSNPYLASVYRVLGFGDQISFLILLAVGALIVVLARIGITALTTYATIRYSLLRSFTLSNRLLQSYMSRPYRWFLGRHSADMGRNVLAEVEVVVQGNLMQGFSLIASLIVIASLISVVIAAQPRVAVAVTVVVGAAYGLLYLVVRPHIGKIGLDRFNLQKERFQIAQEMFGGIKEVKIAGLENAYLRRFSDVAHRLARVKATQAVLGQMPRHFLEALAVGGIMTVVLLLLIDARGDLSRVLPLLALYAFAGLRLLPTAQQLYGSLISLRFGGAALNAIHADLMEMRAPLLDARSTIRLPLRDRIEVRRVYFTYPKAEHPTLIDTSLTIAARTTVGFVGSTGAGKTTLVDVIIGLLDPQQGEVRVDGELIKGDTIRDWQQAIGYVPQHIFLVDDTVAANIAFGVSSQKIDMQAVEQVSRMAGLHEFITRELPQTYATRVGERGIRLSGGQRQRVAIARALYHDPDVLVLDEATSALDNLTERAIMDAVRNLAHHKTIIIIAHRLSTVKACDRLFLLEHGRVKASGTYDELLTAEQLFRQMAFA